MGLFVVNMEEKGQETVKGLLETVLANLDLYSDYCSTAPREGRFKDEFGQTPPDYLVKDFAMTYLKQALEILEKSK